MVAIEEVLKNATWPIRRGDWAEYYAKRVEYGAFKDQALQLMFFYMLLQEAFGD